MAQSYYDNKLLYEPFATIRLLKIPCCKRRSKFDGTLVSFAFNSPECPKYVALSYAWGPPTPSTKMNINGHEIEVLPSLHAFLKIVPDLEEFSPDTWWWIDSICINQRDKEEHSSQMKIMGEIYKRAVRTVVWLGERVDETLGMASVDGAGEDSVKCDNAINTLYQLHWEKKRAQKEEDDRILTAPRSTLVWKGEWKSHLQYLRDPDSGLDWEAVRKLLLRPWWSRVWTLQEFLISDDLVFYCGKESISRGMLMSAIYTCYVCKAWEPNVLGSKAFHAVWNRRRVNQGYERRRKGLGLITLLAYVSDNQATYAQDRVWSLCGVARDACMVESVDNTTTAEEVYAGLVDGFINKYTSLDVICYSHLFNHASRKPGVQKTLPSWIPDWRANVVGKVVPVMAAQGSNPGTGNFRPGWAWEDEEERRGPLAKYQASGKELPRYQIIKDGKILASWGLILDKIDGLGGSNYNDVGEIAEAEKRLPLVQSVSEFNLDPNEQRSSTAVLMETITRCLVLNRKDRYLSEHIAPGLFQNDLGILCKACSDGNFDGCRENNVPKSLAAWFDSNKTLLVQGRTLEDIFREGSLQAPLPGWKDFNSGSLQQFRERMNDTLVTMARRLAVTSKGYLAMAASKAEQGDLVCVLFGCSIPVILRERKGDEAGTFEFIGECYLDGFMNGEALDKEHGFVEEEFHIA